MTRKPPNRSPGPDREMTCAEIAQELGISRERVRQIEKNALAKFKKGMVARGYTLVDLPEWSTRARKPNFSIAGSKSPADRCQTANKARSAGDSVHADPAGEIHQFSLRLWTESVREEKAKAQAAALRDLWLACYGQESKGIKKRPLGHSIGGIVQAAKT